MIDDWEEIETPAAPPSIFPAMYHGRCGCCGFEIESGDPVGYLDDELCCEDCVRGEYPPV